MPKTKKPRKADIKLFCFNGQDFRSIKINGKRMFAPVDIYRCLGAAKPASSARHFLLTAKSTQATEWPYPGRRPRVIDADGVFALLDSVHGVNRNTARAFREWFQAEVLQGAGAAPTAARMADIAGKLDPDVQASLRDAFRAVQAVSARIAVALEKRTELMAALAVERTGQTN